MLNEKGNKMAKMTRAEIDEALRIMADAQKNVAFSSGVLHSLLVTAMSELPALNQMEILRTVHALTKPAFPDRAN
jgi:hypothetical protein